MSCHYHCTITVLLCSVTVLSMSCHCQSPVPDIVMSMACLSYLCPVCLSWSASVAVCPGDQVVCCCPSHSPARTGEAVWLWVSLPETGLCTTATTHRWCRDLCQCARRGRRGAPSGPGASPPSPPPPARRAPWTAAVRGAGLGMDQDRMRGVSIVYSHDSSSHEIKLCPSTLSPQG